MTDLLKAQAEAEMELAALDLEMLCERLRGTYRIPVNDGCGPLNGSNEFVRKFQTGPIQHEAAKRLEFSASTIAALRKRVTELEAEKVELLKMLEDAEHGGAAVTLARSKLLDGELADKKDEG